MDLLSNNYNYIKILSMNNNFKDIFPLKKKVLSEEENNSDFSGIYDQPRDNQSPMEVKSNYPSQTFVRHGFGRMSATSKISFDQESDIYTSLEDMGQSEVEENHSKTTVRHCISKFNSNSTPTEGKKKLIITQCE